VKADQPTMGYPQKAGSHTTPVMRLRHSKSPSESCWDLEPN
jgi:hypothetical protein